MSLKLILLVGSVRSDRQGIKAARFVERSLIARGHDVTLVDPVEARLPLLDRMYKEYEKGTAPQILEDLATIYRTADAFVVVTGEYNHSIPPALSNLLDHFLEEYFFRPSAIVCYSSGAFGGVRAAIQLRAMLCELGMPSISSLFPIPSVQTTFDEDGTPRDRPPVERRFARFASELEWYAEALRDARKRGVPY
jgi:NAD(P)H-dependent FMN reductase